MRTRTYLFLRAARPVVTFSVPMLFARMVAGIIVSGLLGGAAFIASKHASGAAASLLDYCSVLLFVTLVWLGIACFFLPLLLGGPGTLLSWMWWMRLADHHGAILERHGYRRCALPGQAGSASRSDGEATEFGRWPSSANTVVGELLTSSSWYAPATSRRAFVIVATAPSGSSAGVLASDDHDRRTRGHLLRLPRGGHEPTAFVALTLASEAASRFDGLRWTTRGDDRLRLPAADEVQVESIALSTRHRTTIPREQQRLDVVALLGPTLQLWLEARSTLEFEVRKDQLVVMRPMPQIPAPGAWAAFAR